MESLARSVACSTIHRMRLACALTLFLLALACGCADDDYGRDLATDDQGVSGDGGVDLSATDF